MSRSIPDKSIVFIPKILNLFFKQPVVCCQARKKNQSQPIGINHTDPVMDNAGFCFICLFYHLTNSMFSSHLQNNKSLVLFLQIETGRICIMPMLFKVLYHHKGQQARKNSGYKFAGGGL